MRSLRVQLNGEQIGVLSEGNDLWVFEYEEAWQTAEEGFDLSPALPRAEKRHQDGGSLRPVQWYFDNLLPEDKQREAVSREAGIQSDDAFSLLAYLGRESAGSLVLSDPQAPVETASGLKPLPDAELSERIRNMPRVPLSSTSPKRMSAAGAQNKLLVVYQDGALFEPLGNTSSTHILKPDHPGEDYPSTVINEFFVMKLAQALGLPVPQVHRRYVPEPVYLIDRFDRYEKDGQVLRSHIIDACQLLNKSRLFKYSAATLDALGQVIQECTNRARTRMVLFQWLLYCTLVGNNDNHLKNLSFKVDHEGVSIAPLYDILSTMVYHSTLYAQERADWPNVPMTLGPPGCATFADVNRAGLFAAGARLGLPPSICGREIDRMANAMLATVEAVSQKIEQENASCPAEVQGPIAGERRLVGAVRHIVVAEMLAKIRA